MSKKIIQSKSCEVRESGELTDDKLVAVAGGAAPTPGQILSKARASLRDGNVAAARAGIDSLPRVYI
jgi:hypothetical protein